MSEFFFNLTPEVVLDSIESIGKRCTGRSFALNSLENRVYELELEDNSRVVGKFYRPGRWTKSNILAEHEFLNDLAKSEVPVVEPLKLNDGSTIGCIQNEIFFTVFPKVAGRAPDELNDIQLLQLGRFIGRIHNVGAQRKNADRMKLTPESYGILPLKFLIDNRWLPLELERPYKAVCESILDKISPWFSQVETHRIHGDCHMGNLLYKDGPFFLDFDDMLIGPAVQDLWLLTPGQDEEAVKQRQVFLQGYSEMRQFDQSTMRLIEPLRAMRFMHFSAWIAKRWKDPAFPKAFPEFNTHQYWSHEIQDLQKQLNLINEVG